MSTPMSLPAQLAYGNISIYGIGSNVGISGIVPADGFLFGTVDAISEYGIFYTSVGDSVLFNPKTQVCKITWDNSIHTILPEEKIVLKEYLAP